MKFNRIAIALAAVMCTASLAGFVLKPHQTASQKGAALSLESMVPRAFGEWAELPTEGAQVVNPQTKELLDKLYSQTLTRTYVDRQGYRVMLSLAYGDDQRGGLAAHRPEVCYPAQGFKLGSIADGALSTRYGNIDVRRLVTSYGPRNEPVTYWLTVGDQIIKSNFDKRIAEIRLGLTGQIPDGLLFRVSSIDKDDDRAFAMQSKFTADMLLAVPAETRRQLSGLAMKSPASPS